MKLLFGWRGRVRLWPRFGPDQLPFLFDGGPGVIKIVSTDALEALIAKATQTPYASARGRPEWLDHHRNELGNHYVVPMTRQAYNLCRCVVITELRDRPTGFYSLDLNQRDYAALPDISPTQLVDLAHRYLATAEHVPVDEHEWNHLPDQPHP